MTEETAYLKLFPLSLVLFPGINVPLHIFEERYKLMVNECLENDEPFGIVLMRDDADSSGRAQHYSVGTSAWINNVERLDDGRMNIIVQGGRRFRVVEYRTDQPYLAAEVEFLEPKISSALSELAVTQTVTELFTQYVDRLVSRAGHRLHKLELPDDPESLISMVGSLLAMPVEQRQQLLEELNLESVLQKEADLLERQIQTMEASLPPPGLTAQPAMAVPLDTAKYRSHSSRN